MRMRLENKTTLPFSLDIVGAYELGDNIRPLIPPGGFEIVPDVDPCDINTSALLRVLHAQGRIKVTFLPDADDLVACGGGSGGSGITLAQLREYRDLGGAKDGVNLVYTLPDSDKAIHAAPGAQIKVYWNGQRLAVGATCDFIVSESGGAGTGYDTVTLLTRPPKSTDVLYADYLLDLTV